MLAGNQYYRDIGTTSMRVANITITPLNDTHVAAKVSWHSEYRRKDGNEVAIDFDVIYLLQYRNDTYTIFAYITGDEQAELRKHGLV